MIELKTLNNIKTIVPENLSEDDTLKFNLQDTNKHHIAKKYYEENGVNYLREYKIKEYILTELPNYKNEENTYVKEYNEMIAKAKNDIKTIREKWKENKKYEPPSWTSNINL